MPGLGLWQEFQDTDKIPGNKEETCFSCQPFFWRIKTRILETPILPCSSLEERHMGQDRVRSSEENQSAHPQPELGGGQWKGSMDLKALLDAGTQPSSVQFSLSVVSDSL